MRKILGFLFLLLAFSVYAKKEKDFLFKEAVPVWVKGRETEMNLSLGFRGHFVAKAGQSIQLKMAASTLYRAYLNGQFIGSGPARAAHGYFRTDEYGLDARVKNGDNILVIEVAGYNVNSYYTLDQPSFLLAEVVVDGNVELATGSPYGFEVRQLKERLQKVERYSFQRPFTEYYCMSADVHQWRTEREGGMDSLEIATFPLPKLLPRNVQMPDFHVIFPQELYAKGSVQRRNPESYYKDRSLTEISAVYKGYPVSDLEVYPVSQEVQELSTVAQQVVNDSVSFESDLSQGSFSTYNFGLDRTGFIGLKVKCETSVRLFLHFDELLTKGDVLGFLRMRDVCNEVVYELKPGEYVLETMEAYTLKYLKIMALEGNCRIEKVWMREFAYPEDSRASFVCNDLKMNEIYKAALQSSRQNRLDVFMDCPSRERAGWLCDSYFAAVMEKELTGFSRVESNFLENYALPDSFKFLPKGMIPMCYPADHNNGNFIPNWSLWFVLQLREYALRGGDPRLVNTLKVRVEKLLDYFSRFENEDGLLEKLEAWVFVEWSAANNFTQDVNYPSNMLYSAALDCAAKLYGNKEWQRKADHIRRVILDQSYNGQFFIDNAKREKGKLVRTSNMSEVCQYYAFYFRIATPETHPLLWKTLVEKFGPNRDAKHIYPEVFQANAFMGNYMRMDLLSRYGLQNQMLTEIRNYFYPMAEQTGTLWEHMQSSASCNHGFASYIGHALFRDALGIRHIDYVKKTITVYFSDVNLQHCYGTIPIENDLVRLHWKRSGNTIYYSLDVPEGYNVRIEKDPSLVLESVNGF